MCSPSPPPAPDYAGAAQAQGTANIEAARASSKLSNPNITNPYGAQTVNYGVNGDQDQAQVTQTLSPVGQQLFDQQNRISQGLGNIAEGGIGRVGGMLGTQFDMSQVPNRPDLNNTLSRDQVTQAIIDRNQPMADRQLSQMQTQLANQGIMPGSEAYKNSMDDFDRSQNDFRLGAIAQGGQEQSRQFGLDEANRQDAISQQAYLRQLPLNEINALRSGAQVNVPTFQAYQGQNIAPAPIFAGAQAQGQADMNNYNAGVASSNALTSGLFSLGGAALMGPGAGMFGKAPVPSDIRLKENIKRVGTTEGGLPVYTYNYKWDHRMQMGVMAQDVEQVIPDAVSTDESGFKMVDYSKVM